MRVQRRRGGRAVGVALGVAGLVGAALAGLPAQSVQASPPQTAEHGHDHESGLIQFGEDLALLHPGATYRLSPQLATMLGRDSIDIPGLKKLQTALSKPALVGEGTPAVGTKLLWPAIDATNPSVLGIYLKEYELKGVGKKIEVWVASGTDATSVGTAFPEGDCRNDGKSTTVSTEQVKGLIDEFDNTMFPLETKVFSTPMDRAGTQTIPGISAAGINFSGAGDKTVTLVDNVRDPNFYDFPANKTYVAGFFAPIFNVLTDRNVMTIDAFDWEHRTGINPKNEPNKDLCKSRPARPRAYEGVFAHEWQHLLQGYTDAGETTWLNEGLSDYAINLVGYGQTTRGIKQKRAESHLFCFQGFGTVRGPSNPNPSDCGGPQNSLTLWQDEGAGAEVLADYGNAWSFLLFVADRYGEKFITALHNDGANQGLASVEAALEDIGSKDKLADLLHEYQLMNLLDTYASAKGAKVSGIDRKLITTKSLNATVNLKNPAAYDLPGAAPNGADYVLLKDGNRVLRGSDLTSISFEGAKTVAANSAGSGDISIPPSSGEEVVDVENWNFTLVGLNPKTNEVLVKNFGKGFSQKANAATLKAFANFPQVIAVVAHDALADVASQVTVYAPYELKVNGNLQRGG
ncbi:MAG: hypothetical protein ACT4QF_24585 [Sporichthyaceae bacterium]